MSSVACPGIPAYGWLCLPNQPPWRVCHPGPSLDSRHRAPARTCTKRQGSGICSGFSRIQTRIWHQPGTCRGSPRRRRGSGGDVRGRCRCSSYHLARRSRGGSGTLGCTPARCSCAMIRFASERTRSPNSSTAGISNLCNVPRSRPTLAR